ncbi:Lambda repressor-like, DNA-binding domain [Nostoc flagelliforme CCNUN1]|uniref:Lambda repressor-like, DNA-binding domain n=1 Tax=Nostoc flagelliforme CCNUN1 TaxID=2038116 RepID=A0A2K8SKK3_9NOSO|nr:helix-turn-helix transcriptional regulator [Nostoc flagelliforme]AUB35365.1 Lambda repressor-like, DNA-binding domain [Nostoc flagelliforme CCNUN1]
MSAEEQKREYVLSAIASYPSQAQAAIALGTSPRVISQWNTNKATPRELAVRVVQLLEVLRGAGIEIPPPLDF